jgi:hypothetical protein
MPFTLPKNALKNSKRLKDTFANRLTYDFVSAVNYGLVKSTLQGRSARFNYYDSDLDAMLFRDANNLKSVGNKIYALNFVADNFVELQTFVTARRAEGIFVLPPNDLLKMEAKKAYEDLNPKYDSVVNLILKLFIQNYLVPFNKVDLIKNFDDFMQEFFNYAQTIGKDFLITREKFISSKFNNSLHNGLTIEVSGDSHDKLIAKYEKYYENPNFSLLNQSVKQFGFFIDRNAPWRLIANLNSPVMQAAAIKYIRESLDTEDTGEEPKIVFRRDFYAFYYQKAYKVEIENLKRLMFDFYTELTNLFPDYISYTETKKCVKKIIYPKQKITKEEFEEKYKENYWIKTFFNIRKIELNLKVDDKEQKRIEKEIDALTKNVDMNRVLDYTQSQIKRIAFSAIRTDSPQQRRLNAVARRSRAAVAADEGILSIISRG